MVMQRVIKAILFVTWIALCFKVGWDSLVRMGRDSRKSFMEEALFYYNPPLLLSITLWLWGLNLWLFARYDIGYSTVFGLDEGHLSHQEIWMCARWMTFVFATSLIGHAWLYSHGGVSVSLAVSHPVLLYATGAVILVFPYDVSYMSSRLFFLRTVYRIVAPWQAIGFPDIFLADIFTSMMMVFSNLERSKCRMFYWMVTTNDADSPCASACLIILVSLLPFIFRTIQCLRLCYNSREQRDFYNALKYASAAPVVILTTLKFYEYPDNWLSSRGLLWCLWFLSSVVYSSYSFCWDFMCTWDLSPLKPSNFADLLEKQSWVYIWVMGSNFFMRWSWIYKLSPHLCNHQAMVVVIAALEIFRRFQWAHFFVENEWKKAISRLNE